MTVKRVGYALILLGLAGAAFSLLGDVIGLGDDGIQAAQILGIEMGVVLVLIGIGLVWFLPDSRFTIIASLKSNLLNIIDLPVFTWVLVGFVIVYLAFFLYPVFLNSKLQMVYINRFLPNTSLIGSDIRVIMEYVRGWLVLGHSPYYDQFIIYPPLALVFFAPLVLIGFPANFLLITCLTLASYILIALILPLAMTGTRDKVVLSTLFLFGLFSYGLQFEIERGQFNLIAFALCFLAIFIFHKYPSLRYFAYILFVVSIQLKIYPVLFVLMFVDDWSRWKTILKQFLGFGFANFLLFFVLGIDTFRDFWEATLQRQLNQPASSGNSIHAFVYALSNNRDVFSDTVIAKVGENQGFIELALFVIFGLCMLILILQAVIRHKTGFNPYIFLACTVGALILPATSYDYKLPLLIGPVSILFSTWPDMETIIKKIASISLLLIVACAFWSTFYPLKVKPEFMHNSLPILILMLLSVVLLVLIAPQKMKNAT